MIHPIMGGYLATKNGKRDAKQPGFLVAHGGHITLELAVNVLLNVGLPVFQPGAARSSREARIRVPDFVFCSLF